MASRKGRPNKLTSGGRHAIFEVFEKIGGVQNLAEWAKANPNEFYKLWGKTIPQHTQLTGIDGGAIETKDITKSDAEILAAYLNKK